MKNIGIDIIELDRVEKVYKKFGEKFLEKILTKKELNLIYSIKNRKRFIEKLAGIFAMKEAIIKCLGDISYKDVTIFYENRRPFAEVKGEIISVSVSHNKNYAVAVAIKG